MSYSPTKQNNSLFAKRLWGSFNIVFWLSLITLFVLKVVVFQQVTVVGASMEPNYFTNETLLVNQIDRNLRRGQVVAAYENKAIAKDADYFTRFRATFLLKRVIGLPGEEIELLGSKVIIYNSQFPDGAIFNEDYVGSEVKFNEDRTGYYYPRTKIPENEYFLMGDNRANSSDSRVAKYGPFPDYSIFGQESVRFWPLQRLDFFDLPNYQPTGLTDELKNQLLQAEIKFKNTLR